MSKIPPELPEALVSFARERLGGTYEERYAAVLDEAFYTHKLFLNATNLKHIVGGGSMSTAQRAVEDFKGRLHKRINYSIDLGGNVPQEIASKFANALDAFWGLMRQDASAKWEADRADLQQELDTAETNERAAQTKLTLIESKLEDVRAALDQLTIERDALDDQRKRVDIDLAAVRQQLDASTRAEQQFLGQVGQLQSQLSEQAERAARAYEAQTEKFRATQHEDHQAHMLQLDAVRTQARADVARAADALAKAREQVTQLTVALSVAQAGLVTAKEETRLASASKVQAEAALLAAEHTAAELRDQLAVTSAQFDASRAQSVDALGILAWLHDLEPEAPGMTAIPWPASSPEARLAQGVLQVLHRLSPGK